MGGQGARYRAVTDIGEHEVRALELRGWRAASWETSQA